VSPSADLKTRFLDRYRLAAVIQAIEDDLRSFLRQHVVPYHDASSAFGDRLSQLEQRANRDGHLDPALDALVDYLDFGDAFGLLNRHRGMLPAFLAQAVRALTPGFEMAVPIRNRVMHGRPLRETDEEHIARLGQSVVDVDADFPLTLAVVAHLVDDPLWTPVLDISPSRHGNVLHKLPLPEFDETGLLGRDEELGQVRELLNRRRYPVVTIAGEGGIGKTALAVQVLYDLADSSEVPFEAILWTSLKTERLTGRGVEQIRGAAEDLLSLTTDLTGAIAEGTDADIPLLAELLEGTPTLVAIDNVESISPNEIRELIDALPDAQFLLTSRVGLGEIERRITLGALGSQAGKKMLRHLANRRELPQLARASDRQADEIVQRLRGTPLAIRWFVEAVQAGGQPDALLHDQSAVLRFCMSSIYDSLAPAGRVLVDCLLALEGSATVGQLALLTELDRDDVQDQLYELQRRAVVQVDPRLSESLSQSYALGAMPRDYLRHFGALDDRYAEEINRRLREIAATDELQRRFDNTVALEPMAIVASSSEERAVATVLRRALQHSRRGEIENARSEVTRARDAVPAFFETYRVGAFIESDRRPEESRRLYHEAYRLAPDVARPKVAYWLAGHLLNMMTAAEAEPYAREAHDALGLPGTALTLARVCMYEGSRFNDAEVLLDLAAAAETAKTRIIAETLLLDLAKRRAEASSRDERRPAAAMETLATALHRAESVLATGVVDGRYEADIASLVSEALLVALHLPDVSLVAPTLEQVLEMVDRNFYVLSRQELRQQWAPRLGRLCSGRTCPGEIIAYGMKLEHRLEQRLVVTRAGRLEGQLLEYSAKKGYGFIRPDEGDENVFFHKTQIQDPHDALLLTRGARVTYVRDEEPEPPRDGKSAPQARDLAAAVSERERARAIRGRRARVVYMDASYLLAEDVPTQERLYVHRSAFQDQAEWRSAREGTVLIMDLEYSDRGPRALRETARTVPG
jgi:cold shock CspA family protein